MSAAAPSRPPTVIGPLTATLLAAVGTYLTWSFFVATEVGQTLDALAFSGSRIGAWRLDSHFKTLLDTVSLPLLGGALALVLLIGVARRQWFIGVLAAATILGANLSTQVLKYVTLTRPDFDGIPVTSGGANTLPSGHTTVGASIVLGLLLVVPPVLRVITALAGSVVVTAFGYATLVNQWHRPSDTVAAVLVVFGWAFLAITVHRAVLRWRLVRARPGAWFVVLLLAGIVALGLAAAAGYVLWGERALTAGRELEFVAYVGGTSLLAGVSATGTAMLLAMLQSAKGR